MCGLIGGYVGDPETLKDMVRRIFQEQRSRGVNGFGLGIRKPDGALLRDRVCTEKEIFNSWLWDHIEEKDYFLFHHRIPTSTFNTPECNHPIMVENEDIMVIHNGSLGTWPLFHEHDFETQIITVKSTRKRVMAEMWDYTDSEIAVHYLEELAFMTGGDWPLAAKHVGDEFKSTFLFLTEDFNGILYSARTNPMYAYRIGKNVFMASQRGILKTFGGAKDLEPGYGSIREGVLYHDKPDGWGTVYSSNPYYLNQQATAGDDGYTGMFDGYMRQQAEERSGIKHPKVKPKVVGQDLSESELRDKTETSTGTTTVVYPLRRGERRSFDTPLNKNGIDWPGHPNYVWPQFAIMDSKIDMITMIKEASVCADVQEENKSASYRLNQDTGEWDEDKEETDDDLYPCLNCDDGISCIDCTKWRDVTDENEDCDDEKWVARCECAGSYMSLREHRLLYPDCDDNCDQCVCRSCPFHPIHPSTVTDEEGNVWHVADTEELGYGGMV
ncbi:hypothetical protein LCGC14_0847000 [marine sediment metagenome]|uniref:Glutamine amidotransferase type-2 domain-containing protein n=1 Tax=marine sediment metagenome TaxID=412755 RepID=A0A0F9PBB2_9ZZZZ